MDFIKKKRNRELVLTTLIDLLVQILFIFTIVLIIKVSTEAGKNGSFNDDLPDVWNTLVKETLGANALSNSPTENAQAIKDKIKKLEEEIEKLKEEIKQLKTKLGGGAPGKPLCLDSDKKSIDFILEVKIIDNSTMSIQPTATASDMMASGNLPLIERFGNIPMHDFKKKFSPWRDYGDNQPNGGCRYKTIIRYSDNISASVLDRTQKIVGELFYTATRGEQ